MRSVCYKTMSRHNPKYASIPRSTGLRGTIAVPPDKSVSHRTALAALLSENTTTIHNYLPAQDTLATLEAVKAYGARVDYRQTTTKITGIGLSAAPEPSDVINTQNSGTLVRIILGISCRVWGVYLFYGGQ